MMLMMSSQVAMETSSRNILVNYWCLVDLVLTCLSKVAVELIDGYENSKSTSFQVEEQK